MRGLVLRVFLLLLLSVSTALGQFEAFTNETQYCQTCHATSSSWLRGKGKILHRWLEENRPKEVGHHWWFKKETFSSLLKLPITNRDSTEVGFYEQLSLLETDYEPGKWQKLMERGQREIPGFGNLWKRARALPLKEQDRTALLLAMREPYSKMHFSQGEEFHYHSSHRMHVGKILLFFGGMREFSLSETLFKVRGVRDMGYEMSTSYGSRGKPAPLHATFTVDRSGTLKSIDSYVPYEDFRLKNLADFFARGGGNRFGKFSFEKTIFLKKRSRMTRSSVDVILTIEIEGMMKVNDEPCLVGSFTIKEKPDGHHDRFNLWGKGRFIHLPDGLVACQETNLKFRIKLFGIPLVKGSVAGRSWLAPNNRELGPYRPSLFGWCKED